MTEITIEEKKRLVEWLASPKIVLQRGELYRLLDGPPDGEYRRLWTPELGGDDLSELLAKLDYEQRGELYYKLPPDTTIPNNFDVDDLMDICLWFQDNKNAPTIVKAILEVIG